MRVLIDECVDPRVKLLFTGHQVSTVHEKGWGTLDDGPLLALAQIEFDVLLTIDGSLEFQQNLAKFGIGIVLAQKTCRYHFTSSTRRFFARPSSASFTATGA